MHPQIALLVTLMILVLNSSPTFAVELPEHPYLGAKNAQREASFDALLKAANLEEWMKRLAARPHHVGSVYDKENAEFIAGQFRAWGYDTRIEEFNVLFPTPKSRLLELISPEKFTARLEEPALPEDATSGQINEQLPSYNAYSIDGDVTGELVYVNYGVPKDYEELELRGIDVKGKIVIARYGGSWRGIKPKVAAEHGAIGCLIYSDPRDDGYFRGDVYPRGAYRNEHGVQRGSVADMPLHPGDPLTPFIGATKDARRLPIKEAKTLTQIPVLPISYSDALPLLRNCQGPIAPEHWRGALPITYHLGPGPANVHLKVEFNWDVKPIYNVVARLKGSTNPEEWIIRGNHHDAWVNGADDPVSGQVAMMEEARAIAELVRQGWKPRRTIVYCSWDGEEPGLLGSTEWVETHAIELKRKAVVYINSDANGRGFLYAGGSHTLERFVNGVTQDVTDPQKNISVRDRLRARLLVNGSAEERKELEQRTDLRLSPLGSGSDYTPFLQHLGVPALNIGFGGEDGGGSYHSIYDSYDHYTRFGDPGFAYGVCLAKVTGRLVMRLADADVLPFDFTNFGETIGSFVTDLIRMADGMRDETALRNRMIEENLLTAEADPKIPFVLPKVKAPVPYFNFAPLQNSLMSLQQTALEYDRALKRLTRENHQLSAEVKQSLNHVLKTMEQLLTRPEGLPRRPWFAHHIYAPGFYTGYGVKTLPGVREAIEERQYQDADEQIHIVARILDRYTSEIEKAILLVSSSQRTRNN